MDALLGAFSTAISGVGTDVMSFMQAALPIALGVVTASIAVTIGIRFFKRITKG